MATHTKMYLHKLNHIEKFCFQKPYSSVTNRINQIDHRNFHKWPSPRPPKAEIQSWLHPWRSPSPTISFYRWGNWAPERESDELQVIREEVIRTKLGRRGPASQLQAPWLGRADSGPRQGEAFAESAGRLIWADIVPLAKSGGVGQVCDSYAYLGWAGRGGSKQDAWDSQWPWVLTQRDARRASGWTSDCKAFDIYYLI